MVHSSSPRRAPSSYGNPRPYTSHSCANHLSCSRVVTTFLIRQVLGDDSLRAQYYKECESMAVRIGAMRAALRSELEAAG